MGEGVGGLLLPWVLTCPPPPPRSGPCGRLAGTAGRGHSAHIWAQPWGLPTEGGRAGPATRGRGRLGLTPLSNHATFQTSLGEARRVAAATEASWELGAP